MPSADELSKATELVEKAGAALLVIRTVQEAPDDLDEAELIEFVTDRLEEKNV